MDEKEKWIGPKALSLLRPGAFRRYIIGSLISDSGTWMQMMAQSWVMSGLTNKAILLGLVNFAAGLPALALAPTAGALASFLRFCWALRSPMKCQRSQRLCLSW